MGLINADVYLKKVCTYKETGCGNCKFQTTCPIDMLIVDAVPVIRCKDCKYHEWDCVDVPYGQIKCIDWCDIRFSADGENAVVAPNDFCSWAERREE